jgi:thiol-disulfide isomerase/thioredoxin
MYRAPEIKVSEWFQGTPTTLSDLKGKPVVLHMFQVNCPGCFVYSIPKIYDLEKKYAAKGVEFIGLAVRFEEYDQNTKENVKAFLEKGSLTKHVKSSIPSSYAEKYSSGQIKLGHRIGWDAGEAERMSETFRAYSNRGIVQGTPYEYLIGRDGRIIVSEFDIDKEEIEGHLDKMLKA